MDYSDVITTAGLSITAMGLVLRRPKFFFDNKIIALEQEAEQRRYEIETARLVAPNSDDTDDGFRLALGARNPRAKFAGIPGHGIMAASEAALLAFHKKISAEILIEKPEVSDTAVNLLTVGGPVANPTTRDILGIERHFDVDQLKVVAPVADWRFNFRNLSEAGAEKPRFVIQDYATGDVLEPLRINGAPRTDYLMLTVLPNVIQKGEGLDGNMKRIVSVAGCTSLGTHGFKDFLTKQSALLCEFNQDCKRALQENKAIQAVIEIEANACTKDGEGIASGTLVGGAPTIVELSNNVKFG